MSRDPSWGDPHDTKGEMVRVLKELLPRGDHSVLVLTNDFPPQRGGIQTVVRQVCDEFPPGNLVVYAPAHPRAAGHDSLLGFTVVRDASNRLLPTPRLARRVGRVAREHGCDTVVYGASVPLGLLAPYLARAGIETQVALTHGHEVWWAALPGTRALLRYVADNVDLMTYVSEYTHRRIASAVAGTRASFKRLTPDVDPAFHPGVDGSPVRTALGIAPDDLVVVCVARLVKRKGQDRLIRIWPDVLRVNPRARLLIVGDGNDRRRLQRMVLRRRLEGHVILTGEVDDVAPYYAAGDIFSMPVRNRFFGLEVEGLGLSYLEAQAVGLLVLPGRDGGAPEAVLKQVGLRLPTETDLSIAAKTRS